MIFKQLIKKLSIKNIIKKRKKKFIFVICCPFHKEETPSFAVDMRSNAYYCFSCGKAGHLDDIKVHKYQLKWHLAKAGHLDDIKGQLVI